VRFKDVDFGARARLALCPGFFERELIFLRIDCCKKSLSLWIAFSMKSRAVDSNTGRRSSPYETSRQLPAQPCSVAASFQPRFGHVLETGVDPVAAVRRMAVRGVACNENAACMIMIGRRNLKSQKPMWSNSTSNSAPTAEVRYRRKSKLSLVVSGGTGA